MKEKIVYVIGNSYNFFQQKKKQIFGKALLFQYRNFRGLHQKKCRDCFKIRTPAHLTKNKNLETAANHFCSNFILRILEEKEFEYVYYKLNRY